MSLHVIPGTIQTAIYVVAGQYANIGSDSLERVEPKGLGGENAWQFFRHDESVKNVVPSMVVKSRFNPVAQVQSPSAEIVELKPRGVEHCCVDHNCIEVRLRLKRRSKFVGIEALSNPRAPD